jgi:hypothetical protein
MEAKKLSNEFMQHSAESAAWEEISSDYPLTEGMLEKYADKLDWKEVIGNRDIHWNVPMLEKFKKRIDWHKFSQYANEDILTPSAIEAFKEQWDWDELSENSSLPLTEELLMTYADRWNWAKVINRYRNNGLFDAKGISFYEKYKEYIPESKVQDSSLWREIVEQTKAQIVDTIIARG